MKKILAIVLSVVVALSVMTIPVKAEAAGGTTYYFAYDTANSSWSFKSENSGWMSLIQLPSVFVAGDTISVNGEGTADVLKIKLDVAVSEVGVSGATVLVTAPSVSYAYPVEGASLVINGDVKKAEVYPGTVLQINGNCGEFVAHYTNDFSNAPMFAVSGTVDKATCWNTVSHPNVGTMYSVPAGKFASSENGGVWLAEGEIKTSAPANTNDKKKDTEYDKVPKTGSGIVESALFFLLSAACAVAAVYFKKKEI